MNMKVDVNGLIYLVCFVHIQEGGTKRASMIGRPVQEPEPLVRHTECKILQLVDDKEMPAYISIGYARCHPNDNFVKEKGRQMSMTKALEDGEFTRESKTIFWETYRNWGKKRF